MSLRKNRKRRSLVGRAVGLWAGWKLSRPAKLVAGAVALGTVVAAVRKRRSPADLPDYGPPNESVPSHETLAPAKDAAGQAP